MLKWKTEFSLTYVRLYSVNNFYILCREEFKEKKNVYTSDWKQTSHFFFFFQITPPPHFARGSNMKSKTQKCCSQILEKSKKRWFGNILFQARLVFSKRVTLVAIISELGQNSALKNTDHTYSQFDISQFDPIFIEKRAPSHVLADQADSWASPRI